KEDIIKADSHNVDFTIVTVHWGVEYKRFANPEQKVIADFFVRNGVDAVIGSHPHVVQPIDIYYNNDADSTDISVVVYSLGNFVSNQRNRFRNGGIIFELELMKTTTTRIIDINYLPVWVHRRMIRFAQRDQRRSEYFIIPVDDYYDNPANYGLTPEDSLALKLFYDDTREHLK
ncbi:MAG: CapA family protein, partial [Candidatus Electryoneaceae bacterium]|nr:CapA family protein [Candidatus Electryoneaceae bacterium]